MNYYIVQFAIPEQYNGIGGELMMEKINFKYMGPLIKVARIDAKLTQDDLAERIGVTPRYIMAIENEGKCPALDVWFRLIRTLHISADSIVYPESATTKDVDEQLFLMIRMLDNKNKIVTKATIQAMLDNQ